MLFYSLLSAKTGSCLAAFLDGINPPISVNTVLSIINTIHDFTDKTAVISLFFVRE